MKIEECEKCIFNFSDNSNNNPEQIASEYGSINGLFKES